jgi:hypothetical protein
MEFAKVSICFSGWKTGIPNFRLDGTGLFFKGAQET